VPQDTSHLPLLQEILAQLVQIQMLPHVGKQELLKLKDLMPMPVWLVWQFALQIIQLLLQLDLQLAKLTVLPIVFMELLDL